MKLFDLVVKELENHTAREISAKTGVNVTTAWRMKKKIGSVRIDKFFHVAKAFGWTDERLVWELTKTTKE